MPTADTLPVVADALPEISPEAAERLTNLVQSSQSRPFRVSSIRIDGATHTSSEVITTLVSPILKSETLGDVIAESREACHRLRRLNCFRDVNVVLDTAPTGRGDEINVVLNVVEGPRLYARQAVDVGNYEGNMVNKQTACVLSRLSKLIIFYART
ncbi:hypothetical protein HDV00_005260 [Rhizophlyctis rosea]|nr:hypothetical protein HDV00_005260 [Rhizophlyctis rosea]